MFLKCQIFCTNARNMYTLYIKMYASLLSVCTCGGGTQRGFGGATSKTCFRIETSIFESQL